MFKKSVLALFISGFSFLLHGQNAEPEKMSEAINSGVMELLPLITPDGQTFYYMRQQVELDPLGTYFGETIQTIWYSELQSDGNWSEAKKMDEQFNKQKNNAVSSITPDGNTLLIFGYYTNGIHNGSKRGFSMTHKTADGWTKPNKIEVQGYDDLDKGVTKNAYLLNDGKTIVFCFAELTGSSLHNIYVSFKTGENSWSQPLKLPAPINTDDDEQAAYVASDGVTMYFSSDRKGGEGSNDIYMSRRLDDTWMNWSNPVNLGKTINTKKYDSYLSFDACGDYVYFVRQGKINILNSDIFRTQLPPNLSPLPVLLISGKVTDIINGDAISAAITYFDIETGKELGIASSDPKTGKYSIVLPLGKFYGYTANADNYASQSGNVDLKNVDSCNRLQSDLLLSKIAIGGKIRLNNIFFKTASAELLPESNIELNNLINLLNAHPSMKIEIDGHTDNEGEETSNLTLSKNRSKAVITYLTTNGINASRLKSQGFGESKPVTTNDTKEGRALNRRVEFLILSM